MMKMKRIPRRCKIDWLEFTTSFRKPLSEKEAEKVLLFSEYPYDQSRGAKYPGYARSEFFNGITRMYKEDENGSLVAVRYIFSGSGLDLLRTAEDDFSVYGLLADLKEKDSGIHESVKLNRLDIALDIFNEPRVPLPTTLIQKYVKKKRFRTRTRFSGSGIESFRDISTGEVTGSTLYVGSRSSGQILRIYDKRGEQQDGYHWISDEIERWIRWELEIHDDKALKFADAWLEKRNLLKVYQATLSYYYRPVSEEVAAEIETGHRSAWQYDCMPWYRSLIDYDELSLSVRQSPTSYVRRKLWGERSVTPSNYCLLICETLVAKLDGNQDKVDRLNRLFLSDLDMQNYLTRSVIQFKNSSDEEKRSHGMLQHIKNRSLIYFLNCRPGWSKNYSEVVSWIDSLMKNHYEAINKKN